jgi:hypothetical protein
MRWLPVLSQTLGAENCHCASNLLYNSVAVVCWFLSFLLFLPPTASTGCHMMCTVFRTLPVTTGCAIFACTSVRYTVPSQYLSIPARPGFALRHSTRRRYTLIKVLEHLFLNTLKESSKSVYCPRHGPARLVLWACATFTGRLHCIFLPLSQRYNAPATTARRACMGRTAAAVQCRHSPAAETRAASCSGTAHGSV